MPYITSAERIGIEKGKIEGIEKGKIEGKIETAVKMLKNNFSSLKFSSKKAMRPK